MVKLDLTNEQAAFLLVILDENVDNTCDDRQEYYDPKIDADTVRSARYDLYEAIRTRVRTQVERQLH